jgi:hypothetical protein
MRTRAAVMHISADVRNIGGHSEISGEGNTHAPPARPTEPHNQQNCKRLRNSQRRNTARSSPCLFNPVSSHDRAALVLWQDESLQFGNAPL